MRYVILLFLFINSSINAQIVIKNSKFNEPIPFVHFYDVNSNLILSSDINGIVSKEDIKKIHLDNILKLYINHPFFSSKEILFSELNSITELKLDPLINQLNEVVVFNKKYKYIKISAYYRYLVERDNSIYFFITGIYDFYFNKKMELKKTKIVSEKKFRNKSNILLDRGAINISLSYSPQIDNLVSFSELRRQYRMETDKNSILLKEKNEGNTVGYIHTNNEISLTLNKISEKKPLKAQMFGIEIITLNETIFSSYNKNTFFENISLSNLSYYRKISNFKIKRKREEKYKLFFEKNEIFVESITYVNKIDTNKEIKSTNWTNIKNPFYQELPTPIEIFIKNNLEEL